MKSPKQTKIKQDATHRLIPYRYSHRGKPILNLLADDDEDFLTDLIELEGATNDRLLGESGRLPGISTIELVSGFRLAHIVNATFTHANPLGGRFNNPDRGAWYAGFEIETSQAEIAFHRSAELKEISWQNEEISPYIDYLADFGYDFHDIRGDPKFRDCLDAKSYTASQVLGSQLLNSGSAGVVYPSVRQKGGVCISCFRPPLVLNVREGDMLRFTFRNTELAGVAISD
jgi:RES domain-containing protein